MRKIRKYLLMHNFKLNAYGGLEKIIDNYHFIITEHPFNKVILFTKMSEGRTISMPNELTLPRDADVEMILDAISKIIAGKDSFKILGLIND